MSDKIYQRCFIDNMKLDLAYNGVVNQSELYSILNSDQTNFNPFFNLVENKDDLEKIKNNNLLNIMEYIYLNFNRVHKILDDEDIKFEVDENFLTEYSDYYYLYYLINSDKTIINYQYEYKVIKKAYDMINSSKYSIQKSFWQK